MSFFYVDESLHERFGIAVAAAVYSPTDISEEVLALVRQSGLSEFKSGARTSPALRALRDQIYEVLTRTRIGVIIAPFSRRPMLGADVLAGIQQFAHANDLPAFTVFVDQGLGSRDARGMTVEEVDSRHNGGIQVADLAAHMLAVQLLSFLGHQNKTVPPLPDEDMENSEALPIGEEMYLRLRHAMFLPEGPSVEELYADPIKAMTADIRRSAIFVAPGFDDDTRREIEACLGTVFVGCMH